ncbi:hypothetical protein E2320_013509 [Naja naja]|nr:hypothetical protein E2320_013509 [Naja naja]
MLNPGLELGPTGQAASPAGRTLDVMEAAPMALELAMESGLSQHGEEEGEVENIPSRILLQPIAEEPLCDCDSSPEMPSLACEMDVTKLGESEEGNGRRTSQDEPGSLPLPLGALPVTEQLDKVGTKEAAQEPDHSLDNADPMPGQVILLAESHVAVKSLAGNPVEVPSLVEASSEPGCLLNGVKEEFSVPPGSKMNSATLELTSSSPVADSLEMKMEEEMDFLTDLAENITSEGTVRFCFFPIFRH